MLLANLTASSAIQCVIFENPCKTMLDRINILDGNLFLKLEDLTDSMAKSSINRTNKTYKDASTQMKPQQIDSSSQTVHPSKRNVQIQINASYPAQKPCATTSSQTDASTTPCNVCEIVNDIKESQDKNSLRQGFANKPSRIPRSS